MIQSSWDGGKLVCRPMQKMTLHGLSTQWNYDDCMKNVQAANATSIYEKTTDGTTHFDYKWTDGGVVSYYAAARKDPVTSPTYELEGHTCVVSSPDPKYGMRMSYDGCIGAVKTPDATIVQEYSTTSHMGYMYNWTSGAAENYQTWEYSTVSNPTWQLEGYTCRPSTKINGLQISYDECMAKVLDPTTCSSCTSCRDQGYGSTGRTYLATFNPLAGSDYSYVPEGLDCGRGAGDPAFCAKFSSSDLKQCTATSTYGGASNYGNPPGRIEVYTDDASFNVATSPCPAAKFFQCFFISIEAKALLKSSDICAPWKSSQSYSCTKTRPTTNPKTKDEAITWFKTNKPATSICNFYKADTSGPYLCTKTPSGAFPTTIAEALTYYETNYNADAICSPLKDNAPFQCSGTEQKSYFEIVSLSYSNAEMVFGLLGSFIVLVLYKCKRAKDPDALDEDALMKRLDALEADNKELKSFVDGLRGEGTNATE